VTPKTLFIPLSAFFFATQAQAWEYDPWALCPPPPPRIAPEKSSAKAQDDNLHLSADMGEMMLGNKLQLNGNVLATYQDKALKADEAIYDQTNNTLDLEGDIRFESSALSVSGPSAQIDMANQTGLFPSAQYRLFGLHGRGSAENINVLDPNNVVLEDATYTTCPEQKEDWMIKASRVTLDREKGWGSATHARMSIRNTPFLYFPYMNFPLDERRKTGVLYPDVGYSSNKGAEFALPVYWNIAPDKDATFTPRLMSYHGLQIGSEFRYLAPRHRGTLGLDYLANDKLTGEDRWYYSIDLTGNPKPGLSSRLFLNAVSDDYYFKDFSTNLAVNSTTHMERVGELNYRNHYWNTLMRVQSYQTIDPTIPPDSRPYQRLPQIRVDGLLPDGPGHLKYYMLNEWVNFNREDSVSGGRLDIQPGIALPFNRPGYFIEPELSYRVTQYQLQDVTAGTRQAITRSLPTFSLDSGMIFERQASTHLKQTLEPRIFYLYTPYRDQNEIPIFDTIETDFSLGQLFRRDRFVGADRVGDANQLSVALTSKVLEDKTGSELVSGSLGQIFYFRDLLVTMPGEEPTNTPSSNFVAEVMSEPIPNWRAGASLLWDPELNQTDRSSVSVQYLRDPKHVVNMGYRYSRDNFEQTDLSMAWPLNNRWQALGRWAYSLQDREDIAFTAGLEYESCCWKTRMVARHYVNGVPGGDYTTGIYFQMVFKGLGSLGTDANTILEQNIPGYKAYD